MAKLLIQLLEAPIEDPLARIERGKISDTKVQETGPQVAPKPAMYTQIRATIKRQSGAVSTKLRSQNHTLVVLTYCYPACSNMRRPIMSELGDDYANNNHADAHDDGSDEQHGFPTNLVNNQLENSVRKYSINPSVCVSLTMAGIVLMRKTTPVTPVASSAVVPPVRPKLWKIFVA